MRSLLLVFAVITLTGCGYVGEPLPPALKRPMRVTDLTAIERGTKIVVQFTLPTETTEGLQIRETPELELRFGVCPVTPFAYEAWEKVAGRTPDVTVEHGAAKAELDARQWAGKDLVVGVRVHGPHGRDAGWSNLVNVPVVDPLPTPAGVEAKDVPEGVRVTWKASARQFRVFRRLGGDPNWTESGTPDRPVYLDADITYGKSYEYYVQSIQKVGQSLAESENSQPVSLTPKDTFAPGVPTGLTPVPGTRSVELLWDRNTEKDLAGYRVYRDGVRLSEMIPSPAYSDKAITPGKTYRYQVSAVDKAGNESALSQPVESVIP